MKGKPIRGLGRSVLLLLATAAVLAVVLVPLSNFREDAEHVAASATPGARSQGKLPCENSPDSVPTVVEIRTQDSVVGFDRDCYYAQANRPLTVVFTNTLVGLDDKSPTTLTLVISPSNDPVVSTVDASGMQAIDGSKAVFESEQVTAPDSRKFDLGALAEGSYSILVLEIPGHFLATLVIL